MSNNNNKLNNKNNNSNIKTNDIELDTIKKTKKLISKIEYKPDKATNKTGRKNMYDTRIKPNFEIIKSLKELGHSEENIASFLGVSRDVWYKYKREQADFLNLLEKGKEDLIKKLENTLFRKALGGEVYTNKKTIKILDPEGNLKEERIEYQDNKQTPDNVALIFSLKNLDPARWKEKHNLEVDADINSNAKVDFSNFSKEELLALAKIENIEEEN